MQEVVIGVHHYCHFLVHEREVVPSDDQGPYSLSGADQFGADHGVVLSVLDHFGPTGVELYLEGESSQIDFFGVGLKLIEHIDDHAGVEEDVLLQRKRLAGKEVQ